MRGNMAHSRLFFCRLSGQVDINVVDRNRRSYYRQCIPLSRRAKGDIGDVVARLGVDEG